MCLNYGRIILKPEAKGIISKIQKDFLSFFSEIPDQENFYLTGGTALAEFYLGHRLSYDLDLFTGKPDIVLPFSRELERKCRESKFSLNPIRRTHTFVEFNLRKGKEELKVELAYDSPFRFQEPLETIYKINVNDYEDLIVDKLLAFFGRVEPRDAVDLLFILKNESLDRIMELAEKKDPGFDPYWLAVAFEKTSDFPDDIERWPVEMLVEVDGKEIKELFSKYALDIMEKIKEKKQ
jgi:hypothetical protein